MVAKLAHHFLACCMLDHMEGYVFNPPIPRPNNKIDSKVGARFCDMSGSL
jgi:hypothetical protein